ncbi:MAG: hypothetical protein HOA17_01230 [Candidatus Melainabacteria bacterium]|nr:hypothetical protein [Candidatus Melainabacteria bacterium]
MGDEISTVDFSTTVYESRRTESPVEEELEEKEKPKSIPKSEDLSSLTHVVPGHSNSPTTPTQAVQTTPTEQRPKIKEPSSTASPVPASPELKKASAIVERNAVWNQEDRELFEQNAQPTINEAEKQASASASRLHALDQSIRNPVYKHQRTEDSSPILEQERYKNIYESSLSISRAKVLRQRQDLIQAGVDLQTRNQELQIVEEMGETQAALQLANGNSVSVPITVTIQAPEDFKSTGNLQQDVGQLRSELAAGYTDTQDQLAGLTATVTTLQAQINDPDIDTETRIKLGDQIVEARVQQRLLARAADRVHQTHAAITGMMDRGEYQQAKDVLTGQTGLKLTESFGLDLTQKVRGQELQQTRGEALREITQLGNETTEAAETLTSLATGAGNNATETKKDSAEVGVVGTVFGHKAVLQDQLKLEQGYQTQLEATRDELNTAKVEAAQLLAEGKIFEARDKLREAKQAALNQRDNAGKAMFQNYDALNQNLKQVDSRLATAESVTRGAKTVAIMSTAAAVAIGTAGTGTGLILAATKFTAGTAAGFATGTVIDGGVAATNTFAYGKDGNEQLRLMLEQAPNNLKQAAQGAMSALVNQGVTNLGSKAFAKVFGKALEASPRLLPFLQAVTATGAGGAASSFSQTAGDLLIARTQFELSYNEKYASELAQLGTNQDARDQFKADRLKEAGLDALSMAKDLSLSTGFGVATGALGSSFGQAQVGQTVLKQIGLQTAEEGANLLISMAEAKARGQEFGSDAFWETVAGNMVDKAMGHRLNGEMASRKRSRTETESSSPRADHEEASSSSSTDQNPQETRRLKVDLNTRSTDTTSAEYKHPVLDQDHVQIVMPETGLPSSRVEIEGGQKGLYDTGVRLKIQGREIPVTIPEKVALTTGTEKVHQSEISPKQIEALAQGWQELQKGVAIVNGDYDSSRGTAGGLRHMVEIHAQPITNPAHLIDPDTGKVKQASQFPRTLNETQVLELTQGTMQNVESATVARDGSLMLVANIPENLSHLTPGVDQVQIIINPSDGIVTFMPIRGEGIVRAALVHKDIIPKGGFEIQEGKRGPKIHRLLARGDELNDTTNLVVVQVEADGRHFVRMGGSPQLTND